MYLSLLLSRKQNVIKRILKALFRLSHPLPLFVCWLLLPTSPTALLVGASFADVYWQGEHQTYLIKCRYRIGLVMFLLLLAVYLQ